MPAALRNFVLFSAFRVVSFGRRALRALAGTPREEIAARYLRGEGLEIGALHKPLKAPRAARVRYLDRLSVADLRAHYPELALLSLAPVDIVDDGEKLATVANDSQDFIIANHFLEHCQDPIGAVENMLCRLKPGGVLFAALPDKRHNFDRAREVTSFEHLLRDHRQSPAWSREGHYRDVLSATEGLLPGEAFDRRLRDLMERDYSIHFHVFTHHSTLRFFLGLEGVIGPRFEIEFAQRNGGESVVILRKTTEGTEP